MYCVNCGKPLIPGTKFCGSCGHSIEDGEQSKAIELVQTQEPSKSTVSVLVRLLVSFGFAVLFIALSLITNAIHLFLIEMLSANTVAIYDIAPMLIPLGPVIIASIITVWCFAPRIISDYRNGTSLKLITGRLAMMAVCLIPVRIFLSIPDVLIESRDEAYTLTSDIIEFTRSYAPTFIVFCIVVPLIYKVVKASVAGKPVKYSSIDHRYWKEHYYAMARLP